MSTYSTLIWSGQGTTTPTVIYTVLPGHTLVVRDIEYTWTGTGDTILNVEANASGFAAAPMLYRVNQPADGSHQWEGRGVVPSGGTVSVSSNPAGAYFYISGYDLQD